jgi:hypothetical protein
LIRLPLWRGGQRQMRYMVISNFAAVQQDIFLVTEGNH